MLHFITALLTQGEGYHNFHHEFPYDYRNAIKFYQWDPTKWLIAGLSYVGQTYDLKITPERIIRKSEFQMKKKVRLVLIACKMAVFITEGEKGGKEVKKRGEEEIVYK
jgi:fatty-acid desaturase